MILTYFAPQLYIGNGIHDISFYTRAFGALELKRWSNDDGSIHVAELSINGAVFHLHEVSSSGVFTPYVYSGVTAKIGLFVPDVDAVMKSAAEAGGIVIVPAASHDYGYRQGEILDPFGHTWIIEMRI